METRHLNLVGYLTWLIVGISSLNLELQNHSMATPRALAWMISFVCFIVVYRFTRSGGRTGNLLLLALQTVTALVCAVLQPIGFQPILLVIVAGQLGPFATPAAILWVIGQTALLGLVIRRSEAALSICLAYFAFALFAFFTARIAYSEREARRRLAETHAELKVATELLDISSRTAERLRISRDLHDLMGHHLTALSLNLEVASHLTEGKGREQIEKSQSLTKLLLSDVRDVVSRLRDNDAVDLAASVKALGDLIETPALHLTAPDDLGVADQATAAVALRAVQEIVTNAVRHSEARNLWLTFSAGGGFLTIAARDDGRGCDHVSYGNGLRGMRERIDEAGGSMEIVSARGSGFNVEVRLPQKPAVA
jgi:signal transduction histidine kinase